MNLNKAISTPKAIIIIIVLAVLVVGGIYAYQYWQGGEVKTPQENETANWQTYKNEEYGFEIDYPETWYTGGPSIPGIIEITTFQPGGFEYPKDYGILGVDHSTNVTMEEALKPFQEIKKMIEKSAESDPSVHVEKNSIKEVTIDGAKGYIISLEYTSDNELYVQINLLLSDKNGEGIFMILGLFEGEGQKAYYETARKIINSFHFFDNK